MVQVEPKSSPHKVWTFKKGKTEVVDFTVSGVTIGKPTFEPVWDCKTV